MSVDRLYRYKGRKGKEIIITDLGINGNFNARNTSSSVAQRMDSVAFTRFTCFPAGLLAATNSPLSLR